MTPTGKTGTIYSFCSEANCADGEIPQRPPYSEAMATSMAPCWMVATTTQEFFTA